MRRGIYEPGMMRTYPPRARRDRGVSPTGNSRRARRAPSLPKDSRRGKGSANEIGDRGSENAGMKVISLLCTCSIIYFQNLTIIQDQRDKHSRIKKTLLIDHRGDRLHNNKVFSYLLLQCCCSTRYLVLLLLSSH